MSVRPVCSLLLTALVLSTAAPAVAEPSPATQLEAAVTTGVGLRDTRGQSDRDRLEGYTWGMPLSAGLDLRLLFAGQHGPTLRFHAQPDLLPDSGIAPEHFNLWVADLGYSYRALLKKGDDATLVLTTSAGMSAARADAKWDDGLHFLLPCLPSANPDSMNACLRERDRLRATGDTYDHNALGLFVTTELQVKLGRILVGGAVDQRLLSSVGDAPTFLHYVSSFRATAGLSFDL